MSETRIRLTLTRWSVAAAMLGAAALLIAESGHGVAACPVLGMALAAASVWGLEYPR